MFKSSCANVHDESAAAGKGDEKKINGGEIFLQGKRFQGIKTG